MKLFTELTKPGKLVLLVALLISMTVLHAEKIEYKDAWAKTGYTLTNQSQAGVLINFSINEFSFSEIIIDGTPMQNIYLPGTLLPNDEGAPDLPGMGKYFAIPQGAKAVLTVKNYRTETFSDVEIAPAPRIPLDTDDGPLQYVKNERIYQTDAFYPAEPFKLSDPTQIRGVDAVILGITPFQYNPVTKELIVYRDIEVEITFEGGNGHFGEDRLRSRWFDPILQDAFFNYESLPEIDYSARVENRTEGQVGFEYLIVVPNDLIFSTWAEELRVFRTNQGILTGIVTLDEIGGSTTGILENYFHDAFNNWDIPPVAVLIMADFGTDAGNRIIAPIFDGAASDNVYADVTGNDLPDMVFARMTAQNATHLETMVTKAINNEADPPTNSDYYANPITACGWQTSRWFQICAESVGGFWNNVLGKETTRINCVYSGNPNVDPWSTATNTQMVLDVFDPDGLGYIPESPSTLGGWTGGNATMVNNAINSGAYMLQHRDHGGETGWSEPPYSNSDINGLSNEDLVFVFSINCLTGKFNIPGECFAEKFHRHTSGGNNAGALGIIAASDISYSFVNDTYVWGSYDNMWPDFLPQFGPPTPIIQERDVLPAFGNAAGKYFLQQSNWPYNTSSKQITYYLFHHHGDAFTSVYYEMPQNLAVTHNPILYSGETVFTVTVEEGAFIALTVNGEIIGVAESTGGATNITIEPQMPPNEMLVTITKQNYFRYESIVDIIPPEGPYVVGDSYEINDASGNNNGMMDYGESISLHMTMKNVGVELAENVTVTMTTTDPYVTITDGEEFFGNFDPDQTITINDAFALDCAENIPDGHNVSFKLSSTDGTDVWESYINITGHAPELKFEEYTIDDSSGNNNGILDPGETAIMIITVKNTGSADAYNVMGLLTTTDPYITILTTDPQEYGDLLPDETADANFTVSADESIPAGYIAELDISFTADMGISQQDVIELVFPDYCYPTANCTYGDGFTGFSLESISNMNSGCSPNGYGDFTGMSTDLQSGTTYTVQWETGYSDQYACLWIDLNGNKEFEDSERLIDDFHMSNAGQVYSTDFTVPTSVMSGEKRLRIRANWQNSAADPCANFTYGETEDYTVVIDAGLYPPPQNLAAQVDDNDVILTWDVPEDLIGYNVYRDGGIIAEEITETTYIDMDLDPGTYYYTVTAVYDDGMSAPAGPVPATISGSGSIIFEPFEDYNAGEQLVIQAVAMGIDYWTTWSNNPGSAEDPYVTDDQAHNDNNSVVIEGTNDAVCLFGDKTEGKYSVSFFVYVPSGFFGYFNLLQEFNGANSQWGMQAFFDAGGIGTVDAGGQGAGVFNYNYDEWIYVELIIDLNSDWGEMFVNGADVVQWQWSGGCFGTGTLNQLGAMNLYAWADNGTPKVYFDDIDFKVYNPLPPPTNLEATVDNNDVTLTWDAPTGEAFIGYNVYRDTELIATEITETTYLDEDLLPDTYDFDVKAVYDDGISAGAGPVEATIEGGTDRDMVVLEMATGTWCQYCPGGAMGASDLVNNGHNVAVVRYHYGDDYQTTGSAARILYYGITNYPTAEFDGVIEHVGGNQTQSLYLTYLPLYEQRASKVSLFTLYVEPWATSASTFELHITAEMIYNSYPGTNLVLQCALTESHIPENWWGMTEVNFVCRDMLPDENGTPLSLTFGVPQNILLDLEVLPYDLNNCELVVFIQDNDTKEILQATKIDLGIYVGIDDPVANGEISIYPNPATDEVNIQTSGNLKQVKITNYNGQVILHKVVDGRSVKINTSVYSTGVYFIEISTDNGIATEKLIIK